MTGRDKDLHKKTLYAAMNKEGRIRYIWLIEAIFQAEVRDYLSKQNKQPASNFIVWEPTGEEAFCYSQQGVKTIKIHSK